MVQDLSLLGNSLEVKGPEESHLPSVGTSKRSLFRAFRSNKSAPAPTPTLASSSSSSSAPSPLPSPSIEPTPTTPIESFDSHTPSSSVSSEVPTSSSQSSLSLEAENSPIPPFGCSYKDLSSQVSLSANVHARIVNRSPDGSAIPKKPSKSFFTKSSGENWKQRSLCLSTWTTGADSQLGPANFALIHLFDQDGQDRKELGRLKLGSNSKLETIDPESTDGVRAEGRKYCLRISAGRKNASRAQERRSRVAYGECEARTIVSFKDENALREWVSEIEAFILANRVESFEVEQETFHIKIGGTTSSGDFDVTPADIVHDRKRTDSSTKSTLSLARSNSVDRTPKLDFLKPTVPSSPGSSIGPHAASSQERIEPNPGSSQSSQITIPAKSSSAVSLASSHERSPSSFKWVSVMSTPSTNPRMIPSAQVPAFDPEHPRLPSFGCQLSDLKSITMLTTPLWKKEYNGSAGKAASKQSLRARFSSNKAEWKNRVLVLTSWSEERADPSKPDNVQKVLLGYLHVFKTSALTAKEIGRMRLDAECEIGSVGGENSEESNGGRQTNVLNVVLSKRPKKDTRRTWGDLEDTLTVQLETDALLQNWIHEINSIIFVNRAESVGLGEAARDYRSKHYPLTGDLSLALAHIFERSIKSPLLTAQDGISDSFRNSSISPIVRQPSSSAASTEVLQPIYTQMNSSQDFNEFGSKGSYKSTISTSLITRPILIGTSNPLVGHLAATPSSVVSSSSSSFRQSVMLRHPTNELKTLTSSPTTERSSTIEPLGGSSRYNDSIRAREFEIETLKRTEMELRAELELERLKNVERQLRAELMQERKRNEGGPAVGSEAALDGDLPVEEYLRSLEDSEDRPSRVPSGRYTSGRRRSSTIQSESSSYYYDPQGTRRPSDGTSCTSDDYIPSIVSYSNSIRHQTSKTSLRTHYSSQSNKSKTVFGTSFPSRDIDDNGGLPLKEKPMYQIPSIRFTPSTSLYTDDYSVSPTSVVDLNSPSTLKSSVPFPTKSQTLPVDVNPTDKAHSTTKTRPRSSSTIVAAGGRKGSLPLPSTSPLSGSPAGQAGNWKDTSSVKSFTYRNLSFPCPPPPPPGPAPMCDLPPLPPLPPIPISKTG